MSDKLNVLGAGVASAAGAAAGASAANLDAICEAICRAVDANSAQFCAMADEIFRDPELGLKEFHASEKIAAKLEAMGFSTQLGCYGFDTAIRASKLIGQPRATAATTATATAPQAAKTPRIGLLCEYDALEGLGHACAHHLQAPSILLAACALDAACQSAPAFELIIYGTPAEETLGAKVPMRDAGAFAELDVCFMMHGADASCVDVKSMALANYDVEFIGKAAHAALRPEQGKSALDAALLAFHGIECLREHVPEDTRMHFAITATPAAPNVVPASTSARFSLRSYNSDFLRTELDRRFRNIIAGAALMSDCEANVRLIKRLDGKVPAHKLNELVMKHARAVGMPRITPPRQKTGSTDFGAVTYMLPGTCIRAAFVPSGTSSHSQVFLDCGTSAAAHEALIQSAKVIALSAAELASNDDLLAAVQQDFAEQKAALAGN